MYLTMADTDKAKNTIRSALVHYSEKLESLKDDELIELGGDSILNDIERARKDGADLANRIEHTALDIFMRDYTTQVCNALSSYIADMNSAKCNLKIRLGFSLDTRDTDDAIKFAQVLIKKYCKGEDVRLS